MLKMKLIVILFVIGELISCDMFSQKQIENDSVFFDSIKNTNDYSKFSTFILKYPFSKYFENALEMYYNKRDAYCDSIIFPIGCNCFRNCANIKILHNQELLFEDKKIDISEIKDSLLSFLINKNYSVLKPDQKDIIDINGRIQQVSIGHVKLFYIKDSCKILQITINEIRKSYVSYIDLLSQGWYNTKFDELDSIKQNHLDSLFQERLLLFELDKDEL